MLTAITDGLWHTEHDVRMGGGVIFRARMVVADLGDGQLWVHSPVPIDEELAEAIESRGEVCWIVAPNDQHHLYVEQAAERFPSAEICAGAGVRDKHPALAGAVVLEDGAPSAWRGRLEMVEIHGTRAWHEFVFLLPERRTLICSDLVFNIHDVPNWVTGLLLWVVGARRRFAQSRAERWFFVRDRPSYASSIRDILAWDFDRVVMAHGEIVDVGGRQMLADAVGWALDAPVRGRLSS